MANTFTNPKPATRSAIAQRVVERKHSYGHEEPAQLSFQPITERNSPPRILIAVAFVAGLFLGAWANNATDAVAGKVNAPSGVSHPPMSHGGRGTALEFDY